MIWQLTNGGIEEFSILVFANEDEVFAGMFEMDGKPKHWSVRPRVEPFVDKRKKQQKPLADISYVTHGTIVLNGKAYAALGEFLSRFGQLLELDCNGEVYYFYNVTNLIDAIDVDCSGLEGKSVVKEAFRQDAIPSTAQIFKDPRTAHHAIYVNQAAKAVNRRGDHPQ
ncbi:MAG: hypothetical protein HC872_00335 [Gammaproteobacteria bacterium]|nr:hypothetical protein [Gammaproteobacteria bacterium]